MKKKLVSLMLAATMVVSLAACGSKRQKLQLLQYIRI